MNWRKNYKKTCKCVVEELNYNTNGIDFFYWKVKHIAKNIVANGLARKCELQISYGIGIEEPLSIYIDCFGTNIIPEGEIIKESFGLTPKGIIAYLELNKTIFSKTTNYGHFGRDGFAWEKVKQI